MDDESSRVVMGYVKAGESSRCNSRRVESCCVLAGKVRTSLGLLVRGAVRSGGVC